MERRLIGDGMGAVIVHELGVGNRFRPGCGIIATEDPKVGFDLLVYSFGFSIQLWVIGGGKG